MPGILDWWIKHKYAMNGTTYPSPAEDRFLQTPIVIEDQEPGIAAHYISDIKPSSALKDTIPSNLGINDIKDLEKVVDMWKDKGKGYISISPTALGFHSINHELVHRIFDLGNLSRYASQLSSFVPKIYQDMLKDPQSSYAQMAKPYAGSPEQIADEGMAFSQGYSGGDALRDLAIKLMNNPRLAKALRDSSDMERIRGNYP